MGTHKGYWGIFEFQGGAHEGPMRDIGAYVRPKSKNQDPFGAMRGPLGVGGHLRPIRDIGAYLRPKSRDIGAYLSSKGGP